MQENTIWDKKQIKQHDDRKWCRTLLQINTKRQRLYLKLAFTKLSMSMRGYHKTLKVARTIADIEHADLIDVKHIQEAIIYKS